jgi:hypothetical protein
MLYGLQTASINLRNTDFEAEEVTDVVIDTDDVDRTSINGPQWFEEDFEDEPEDEREVDEDEVDDEADGDAAIAAAPENEGNADAHSESNPKALPKVAAEAQHLTMEEARMKVRGLVRNWLQETAAEKTGASPG